MGNIENKKLGFPKWFIIWMSINCIIVLPILSVYTFFVIYNNKGITVFGLILLFFLLGSFVLIYYFFYSVTATSKGLVAEHKLVGNKLFLWDEIVEVRRPRFGIPYEFTSVISKKGKKIYLLKSMTHYKELVEHIKEKAINLKKCNY
jgi:hypothetical protein